MIYESYTTLNLSFVGRITAKIPKFILKSHATTLMSLCATAVLESQVFVNISFKSIEVQIKNGLLTDLRNRLSSAYYWIRKYSRQELRFELAVLLSLEQLLL